MTTQLWLRKPGGHPEIPRKMLMAESYAALSPSNDTWAKYLTKIQQKREAGEINDQQVKVLVLSNSAREGSIEVTGDRASHVGDETPIEVLAQYEDVLKRPAEEAMAEASDSLRAVQQENQKLRNETKTLREEAADRDDRLASQDRQIGEQDKQLRELRRWKRQKDVLPERGSKDLRSPALCSASLLRLLPSLSWSCSAHPTQSQTHSRSPSTG